MKKLISMLLLAALSLTLCAPALAEEAVYATTKSFLLVMDRMDMHYTVGGIDEAGDEHVNMAFEYDGYSYDMNFFFESSQEQASIFVWYLINFEAKDTLRVMEACSELNASYPLVCFYADTSDNTVTCSMNLLYREKNVGLIVTEAMANMMDYVEAGCTLLAPFDR